MVLCQCVNVVLLPLERLHFPRLGLSAMWDSLGVRHVRGYVSFVSCLACIHEIILNSHLDYLASYLDFSLKYSNVPSESSGAKGKGIVEE